MVAVWSYPWRLLSQQPDTTRGELAELGVTGVNVAAHYHSIRTLDPRSSDTLFESYEGGCYFTPDSKHFADTPIDPPVNDIDGHPDPFADVVERLTDGGIDVNAWLVCFHNTKLATENPEFRVESAFGDAHEHAFCPSNPEVHAYFEGVVRSLADYDISAINLESDRFPERLPSPRFDVRPREESGRPRTGRATIGLPVFLFGVSGTSGRPRRRFRPRP